MAQPSSERERDRDRERDRERRHSSSGHHHHRTISSTTLLLALSLILAVLAITLTIPSYSSSSAAAQQPAENAGLWGYLTPKRAQGLLAREGAVAMREAEVARREAELLAGSPVGIAVPPPAQSALPAGCPPGTLSIVTATQTVTVEYMPTGAVVREVVSEVNAIGAAPHQFDPRVDNLLDRERGVSVREKDVGNREETVGKREQDASRRESWIMEQLVKLGNDKVVEEEIVYDGRDARDGRQDSRDRRDTRDVPPQRKKDQYIPPEFDQDPYYAVPPQHQPRHPEDPYYAARQPEQRHEPYHSAHHPPPSRQQPEIHQEDPYFVPEQHQPPVPPPVHMKPISETIFYEDPSSPTQLAADPAPVVMEDKTQPTIGKTVEYQVVVEKTPAPPEPTRDNRIGAGVGYDAKPTPRVEYHNNEERRYAEPAAEQQNYQVPVEEDNEQAYTTIRRTTSPGIRPPRGWW